MKKKLACFGLFLTGVAVAVNAVLGAVVGGPPLHPTMSYVADGGSAYLATSFDPDGGEWPP